MAAHRLEPAPVAPGHVSARRVRVASLHRWLLVAVLAVAAVDFFWQLGSSSYFIDEVFTVQHSSGSVHDVIRQVSHTEVTPWTYFVAMHEWLYHVGSGSEWIVRFPSAVAGVALVAATYWMARVFVGRVSALGAAGLCALSPLALQYAQQARVYVFVALAATVAVAATMNGVRTRGTRLLWLGAAASVLALWLHYIAGLVILPLCVWLALRRDLPIRVRAAFVGTCTIAELVVLPLFIFQRDHAPPGVFPGSQGSKIVHVLETPFDGRFTNGVDAIRILGAIAVVAAIVVVVSKLGRSLAHRWLLIALAVLAPAAIILIGLGGDDVIISRYTIVAAPFMLTAIVASIRLMPRPAGAALAALALLVSIAGLAASHQSSGFYPPAKAAVRYVAAHRHPSDQVLLASSDLVLFYYLKHDLPQVAIPPATGAQTLIRIAARERRPLWLITDLGSGGFAATQLQQGADRLLAPLHYEAKIVRLFRTTTAIADDYLAPPESP
jgi:mannosyltransferase